MYSKKNNIYSFIKTRCSPGYSSLYFINSYTFEFFCCSRGICDDINCHSSTKTENHASNNAKNIFDTICGLVQNIQSFYHFFCLNSHIKIVQDIIVDGSFKVKNSHLIKVLGFFIQKYRWMFTIILF